VTGLEAGLRDGFLRLVRRAAQGKDPELRAALVGLCAGAGAADELVPIAAAAKRASVSTATIRRRIAVGALPSFGSGKLLRVRLGDVERAFESGRRKPESTLSPERLAELADQEDRR
jgi:hypothetical protein